jgi:ribonuclease HII
VLTFERTEWARGRRRVAGMDEAGRGPLAGPVFAACVLFDPVAAEEGRAGDFRGLTDSKQLTPRARVMFYERLLAHPGVRYGLGEASREEIDAVNILRATALAMRRAVEALALPLDLVLVDGRPVAGLPAPSLAIVGGDRRSLSIAAASVIAKVARDRRMEDLDRRWPSYGFARHKGYGTRAHLAALDRWGPCPEHRRSFRPVAVRMGSGDHASASCAG